MTITTDKEYRTVLRVLEVLIHIDPAPDSPEGQALLEFATEVEAWEKEHYPMNYNPEAEDGPQDP